jgi:hypothetical protein
MRKGMSVYRRLKHSRRSDVHKVAEHIAAPMGDETAVVDGDPPRMEDWTNTRKATPPDVLFPATKQWMAGLPSRCFRPETIARTFPRIANALAALWPRPDAFADCIDDLIGRRGGR